MGRTHPLSTRVGSLVNWSQDVRNPPLSRLVKQMFQNRQISKPFVKASVNSIWIDVTVFEKDPSVLERGSQFTFMLKPEDFNIVGKLLGGPEKRTEACINKDSHYSSIEELSPEDMDLPKNIFGYIFKKKEYVDNYKLFNIHDKRPIYLRITPISSPFLNAQVAAHHIADRITNKVQMRSVLDIARRVSSLNILE